MENVAVHEHPDVESMETEFKPGTVEVTSFTESIEEIYLSKMIQVWPTVELALERHGLTGTLNPAEGSVTVSTTTRTRDPHLINKARAYIVLLSQFGYRRRVAIAALDDNAYYDCIKTGFQEGGIAAIHGMKEELYIKKRTRLFKHIKEVAEALRCSIHIGEDCLVVGGVNTMRLKTFRTLVRRCIVENMNPKKKTKQINKIFREFRLQGMIKKLHI